MTLEIEKLSKRRDHQWIIRDVTFSVKPGEIFGLLAPDGENLTELLRLISGIEKPDSGAIRFDGNPIADGRKAGFYYFSEDNTSRWQQLFSGVNEKSRARSHTKLILDSLNSVTNVFLVENPVQSLDVIQTKSISGALKRATRKNGWCTVIATNDPQEVFQLCDRIAVVGGGEIIQSGTPEEVYTHPEEVAATEVFGDINLIRAKRTTSTKSDIPEFFTIEGEHRLKTGTTGKDRLGTINQTVMLAIRPEHISISFGASFPEDNLIKARVKSIEFRGPTTSIQFDANGLELTAVGLRIVGLQIGEECIVGLPPDRIMVLTD